MAALLTMKGVERYPEQATNGVRSASKDSMCFVYILECIDNSYYVRLTQDIDRRFQEHIRKKGSTYTRRNHPLNVVYREAFQNKVLAAKREKQLKPWSRNKKKALVENNIDELRRLSISHD